jgi:hypothetical protein
MGEIEAPTPAEAHGFLKDDNERRIEALKVRTDGKLQMDQAWTMLRIETYLKHIALDYGILERADLDFESKRSTMLDKIESEVEAFEQQVKQAQLQQKLGIVRP